MTITEIRNMTGLSQVAFAEMYGMSRRTVENWEAEVGKPNHRECPKYVLSLLERAVSEDFPQNDRAFAYIVDKLDLLSIEEITINTCRNGRKVAWYLDETKELCIYIDTMEELTQEEIENELC